MPKIEAGTYEGVTTSAVVNEAKSGAVMCYMQVDVQGVNLRGAICLVQKDGTLSDRGFKDVQAILGQSGPWDWAQWDNEPESFAGRAVLCVVQDHTFTKDDGEEVTVSEIKYLNPIGGGATPLAKGDIKSIKAKYAAKTRAMFGGETTPAKPSAPKAPKAAPKPPAPAAKTVADSTMEACWDKFCENNTGKAEKDLYDMWPKAIADATGGKAQNDLTPQDWGMVMVHVSDNLPY
jgi:hypothetical protein